jgi:hypothetical protein
MDKELKQQELIIFQNKQGEISFRGDFKHETIWASLDQIARLFGRDKSVISRHLKKVYQEEELTQEATVAKKMQQFKLRVTERWCERLNTTISMPSFQLATE